MLDLDALYREHADTVYRYLMVRTNSAELSEELTQETFFQAVRAVDSYDESCKFSTWLIGIAKNVLRTHYRTLGFSHISLHPMILCQSNALKLL